MSEYVIVTDSTTDVTPAVIKEMDVLVMPLTFTIDGKSYKNYPDWRELSHEAFYKLLSEEKSGVTAQINPAEYCEFIEPILKDGKDVLVLAFSSMLSGTYQSSCLAVEDLKEKYPDRKIISVDTRSACMGEGMLVYYAAMQKKAGKSIEEVADWATEYRMHNNHWVTVGDLNHLKRGGRVSAAAALVGTILGIRPILIMKNDGSLVPIGKIRGKKQSLDHLVSEMQKTYDPSIGPKVWICHCDCIDDATYVKDQIKSKIGVKDEDILINYMGPVIGSHTGRGCVALFFMGTDRGAEA